MGKGKGRLGLFVLMGFLCLGAGSAGAIVWGLGRVAEEIQAAPGFSAAWARASTSQALIDALGGRPTLAPFDLVEFVAGRQPWSFTVSRSEVTQPAQNGTRKVPHGLDQIEVPIVGPAGAGSLAIEAAMANGVWEVKKLHARVPGRSEPLDLLASGF